jgi:hypothetical protein
MKYLLYIITVYSLLSCAKLEYENYRTGYGQLEAYHNEYKGGGSGKWRIPAFSRRIEGGNEPVRSFYSYLWIYGVPVYLSTLAGIIIAIVCFFKWKTRTEKTITVVCLILSVAILGLFIYQGVLSGALQQG